MSPYTYPEVPNASVGALFAGLSISSVVYGVTCAQTCRFYRLYPAEHRYLKIIIFLLWIVETSNVFVTTHAVYRDAVTNTGNYAAQSSMSWNLWVASGTNSLSALIVQVYYSRRVYIISQNKLVAFMICFLSVTQFVLTWLQAIIGLSEPNESYHFKNAVTAGFIAIACADILIASSLVYYLQIRKSGLMRIQGIVNSVIVHVISCGVLSSVLSLGGLITFVSIGGSLVTFSFCFVLGKVQANAMLSSLNARASLQAPTGTYMSEHIHMTVITTNPR